MTSRQRIVFPATRSGLQRALSGVSAAILGLAVLTAAVSASAQSRIKDVADFEGVRENLLVGYGLVVGLNGSGDTLTNSQFTQQSLVGMLERLGVKTLGANLKTANVAAVMVTSTLPPFARQGTRIDVTVSALGDAKSLLGGTLLVTPMVGADGEVYSVAQGQLAVGGFSAQGNAGSVTKGVPTSGRIPNGAIVERELLFDMSRLSNIRYDKAAVRKFDRCGTLYTEYVRNLTGAKVILSASRQQFLYRARNS
jgi:flagellar P-ring protein precursor FlgI